MRLFYIRTAKFVGSDIKEIHREDEKEEPEDKWRLSL
jgi:hypothetical protein